MASSQNLRPAPRKTTAEGAVRRVGYELEFAGIPLDQAALLTQKAVGGDIVRENTFSYRIENTPLGDFSVELDASVLKDKRYEALLETLGITLAPDAKTSMEEAMRRISQTVVPCEVVCPPVPMDAMEPIETLRRTLYEHRAQGSGASPIYAFGLQINVEPPALTVDVLLAYLRAFLLLYPWLDKQIGVDLSRRISPYVDPFDAEFVETFLAPNLQPDSIHDFMRTYLELSPTRNRPLDMLPLFAHLDADLLGRFPVEHHLVKARPAFHYRLPNCRIDDPDWSIGLEWERWLRVEELAGDADAIDALSRKYLDTPSFPLNLIGPSWVDTMEAWLAGDR